ncbi:MAG: HEAT repeat domain-containing protein [Planctomycetota bacterium]
MRRTKALAFVFLLVGVLGTGSNGEEAVAGTAAGEPRAGGRPEKNIRYMMPPSEKATEPKWTAAEKARGYVVYSDSYLNSFWPAQKPTRAQIVDKLGCRLARDEYEPIQIGVYGTGTEGPLENVTIAVDIDLPHEVRALGFRDRTPGAEDLKHLGAVDVPYVIKLGESIETIAPGHTGTFWITFHADADAKAGKHTGTIRVTPQGRPATEIPLAVEVLPFTLPKPDIAFGMYYYLVSSWLQNNRVIAERDQAAHGMNSATLYAPGIKLVKDEVTPDGRLEFPADIVIEMKSRIANGLADPAVPVFLADYELVNWHSGRLTDKLSLEEKLHVARLYNTFCAQHGWPRFMVQMQDEPAVDQPKSYFTWAEGWKRSELATGTAMSGKAAVAMGYLHDVWIVHTGQITPEMVREAGRQGAEVWTYTFSMGAYNALSNRYMAGIYTWSLKLRGNYQWAYYHNDHFVAPEGLDPAPLLSWEGRREGVDDYRYLMTLEALLADTDPDDPVAREAREWLEELRGRVDLVFFHGFSGSSRVDGPFSYPAPGMEIQDYDEIRARAADYCMRLSIEKRTGVYPPRPATSLAPKWEASPYEHESVEVCIAALSSSMMDRRRSAATALAMRGEEAAEATDRLAGLLGDPDARIVALRALQAIGPRARRAIGPISELLDESDEYVRMSAALALGNLGQEAVPSLRKALYDDSPEVGSIACEALAHLGEAAAPAVPELIEMLDVPHARHGATLALQGIGPAAAPAVGALSRVFEETGGNNHYIAKALGNIGPAARAAVGILEKRRNQAYWSANINAALFKIRGDTADLEALVVLLTEGGDRYCTEYAATAIEDLGARGAAIAPAVAKLMKEKADFFAAHKEPAARLMNFLKACRDAGVSLDALEESPEGE